MFTLTPRQREANRLLAGPATHILLEGGSRSGKTFLFCRAVAMRALKAPGSSHAIFRFRFNACKQSIGLETWPQMMALCFPGVHSHLNKADWFVDVGDGARVWLAGLDDKERTEKILGLEFATIFLNECSQIPFASREMAITRLAQKTEQRVGTGSLLPLRMYYDLNPTSKAYWVYRLFHEKRDPETRELIRDPENYVHLRMNPEDNRENLAPDYIERHLAGLSERMRRRFLRGEYADANPNALFAQEHLDRWRADGRALPDFVRVVVAVDPSGSGDADHADHDAIGIVVAALGTDGNGYVLEDLTVKAGPATWGLVATSAYDRHRADVIVAETNFGGAMVKAVIDAARPRTHFKEVKASRGKVVRAEPIAALTEDGKIRLAGYFPELEDELAGFTTTGYIGAESPNRADALVWAMTELFPGIVADRGARKPPPPRKPAGENAWMTL